MAPLLRSWNQAVTVRSLRASSRRGLIRALVLGMACFFAIVLVRLQQIQVFPGEDLRSGAASQLRRPAHKVGTDLAELPRRGRILDRNGRVLAASYYEYDFTVDPFELHTVRTPRGSKESVEAYEARVEALRRKRVAASLDVVDAALASLGRLVDRVSLRTVLSTPARADGVRIRHAILAKGLTPVEMRSLDGALRGASKSLAAFRHSCFGYSPRVKRVYPEGKSCVQIVGMVGETREDSRLLGRTGLEFHLDRVLLGTEGALGSLSGGAGREFLRSDEAWLRPGAPADVELTIDSVLQDLCVRVLVKSMEAAGATSASAVMLDARSGEILAAVTVPVPDPSNLTAECASRLLCGAFTGVFEPGSIIKPVLYGYARDTGAIEWEETWDCGGASGGARFGYRNVREFSRNPAPLSTRDALIRSSNVASVRIGLERLGIEGMQEAFRAFRLVEPLKDTLYLDALAGYVSEEQAKRLYDAGVSWPQGYALTVSPLAMARMYMPFASEGMAIQPVLVRAIRRNGEVLRPSPRRQRAIRAEVAREVLHVLHGAVEEGTGKALKGLPFQVAAKTGTPQVTGTERHNPVICAIAPVQHPEVVLTVIHNNVVKGSRAVYTGGAVSGPAAREILDAAYKHLQIQEAR